MNFAMHLTRMSKPWLSNGIRLRSVLIELFKSLILQERSTHLYHLQKANSVLNCTIGTTCCELTRLNFPEGVLFFSLRVSSYKQLSLAIHRLISRSVCQKVCYVRDQLVIIQDIIWLCKKGQVADS